MKIEVLGTERRRRWSLQDKLQIVEETLQPGVTVTEVAHRHGLAPSVVFTWRRLAREARLGNHAGPTFVPVEITPVPTQTTPMVSSSLLRDDLEWRSAAIRPVICCRGRTMIVAPRHRCKRFVDCRCERQSG